VVAARAFRPRNENSHRADEWKRCEPFLKWLRGRPCFISLQSRSHRCEGKVRACHFDPFGDKGMGTKVSDSASMPMCDAAHAEQTDVLGWPDFQSKYAFDGRDVVTAYWLEWLEDTRMGVAWQRKMEAGDAE
jgi:hypothetical protein